MNCFYCGVLTQARRANQPDTKTRDHLTPSSRGGSSDAGNIVVACRKCNGDKGGLTLDEYRAVISLRFGSPVKFWGEGQPRQKPLAAPDPAYRGKLALISQLKFRPVCAEEPKHKRKLTGARVAEIVVGPDAAVWDQCPPLDPQASHNWEHTGKRFGMSLVCIGVISGVKSKAKYACRCDCGRFTPRTAAAVKNEKNKLDACGFCLGGNWMKFNYPYCDQFARERWEDDGGLAA